MFIQIIEFETDRIDEGRKLVDEYEETTQGKRTSRRGILAKDRDKKNHYVNIVFFDDYESAMKNSELPETQRLSEQLMKIASGDPKFYNLDVIDDREM
jgi:quinol monooxygenase YgiN